MPVSSVKRFCISSAAVWLFSIGTVRANQVAVLYDSNLAQTISEQGWPLLATPLIGNSVTEVRRGGATVLDTSLAPTDRAGYFSEDPLIGLLTLPNRPELDNTLGYALQFSVGIQTESHVEAHVGGDDNDDGVADRAGFSVIVVSQSLQAIELGFWSDRIWAQDDGGNDPSRLFTQAESVAIATTEQAAYSLMIGASQYRLMDERGATILSGRLRDYTPFQGSIDPYEKPGFIFLGDNTTRAAAVVQLGSIRHVSYDLDVDGQLTSADIDAWDSRFRAGPSDASREKDVPFDLNHNGVLEPVDRQIWLDSVAEIQFGDANFDGTFNSSDLILVFQSGLYEDPNLGNATWATGDWNGDGDFQSQDVILAFQSGAYQTAAHPVPEPASSAWAVAWLGLGIRSAIARRTFEMRGNGPPE